MVIANLCLNEGQQLDGILNSPAKRVAWLNKFAVDKAKRESKRYKK